MVNVMLCMIVRNESSIIKRCLDTVTSIEDINGILLIDGISICDTGSEDQTIDIIKQFLEEKGVKGKVHNQEWKNFGYNRTKSFELAKQTANEFEWDLKTSYCLFIDADMNFKSESQFDKTHLTHEGYSLEQRHPNMAYKNLRLARLDCIWRSIGVTHEYWSGVIFENGTFRGTKIESYSNLWIDDKGDGGCKADKFERDERLLRKGLEEEPGNERYMFYLAQTLKCLGKHEQSIHWYKKRIDKGGWAEEVWNSMYSLCENYLELFKKFVPNSETTGTDSDSLEKLNIHSAETYESLADYWAIKAFEFRSERTESLRLMANHYRIRNRPKKANVFVQLGIDAGYPVNDCLFIDPSVYQWKMLEEASICGFYGLQSQKQMGYDACNKIFISTSCPPPLVNMAYRNYEFYSKSLSDIYRETTHLNINTIVSPNTLNSWPKTDKNVNYFMTNPCIQKYNSGFRVLLRLVNYTQKNLIYTMYDHDNKVRTKYLLLTLDSNFNLIKTQHVEWKREIPQEVRIIGAEDLRFLDPSGCNQTNQVIGTVLEFRHNVPQIASFELVEYDESTVYLENATWLIGPTEGRSEKNWMPFFDDSKLKYLYSMDKLQVLDMKQETQMVGNIQTRKIDTLRYQKCRINTREMRGGSPLIDFKGGYLGIIHEVSFTRGRTYYHRFVWLSKDFNQMKVSNLFHFNHIGIEFCCGLCAMNDKLFITIGHEDTEAHVFSVTGDRVWDSLW